MVIIKGGYKVFYYSPAYKKEIWIGCKNTRKMSYFVNKLRKLGIECKVIKNSTNKEVSKDQIDYEIEMYGHNKEVLTKPEFFKY